MASQEEGPEGAEGGHEGALQPVRPAGDRGRGPARQPRAGVRVRAQGLQSPVQRQVADVADLRRQEAAEGDQEGRGFVKDASVSLREAPKKKRGGFGKFLVLGLATAGVALAVSSDLRKKVLDTLFGAEEEFEYTSTTTASTPSGDPAGASQN